VTVYVPSGNDSSETSVRVQNRDKPRPPPYCPVVDTRLCAGERWQSKFTEALEFKFRTGLKFDSTYPSSSAAPRCSGRLKL